MIARSAVARRPQADVLDDVFLRDVIAGLTAQPKRLSPKHRSEKSAKRPSKPHPSEKSPKRPPSQRRARRSTSPNPFAPRHARAHQRPRLLFRPLPLRSSTRW